MKNNKNTNTVTVLTPDMVPVVVIPHNKYGNKDWQAFGAIAWVEGGKTLYETAHLRANGIGTEGVARIAFNEYARSIHQGCRAWFFSSERNTNVRQGCYFREVTASKAKAAPARQAASKPAPAPAPKATPSPAAVTTPAASMIRALVKGTNTAVLNNAEFQRKLNSIIVAAKEEAGGKYIEFVSDSLGDEFLNLGVIMHDAWRNNGINAYTVLVADATMFDDYSVVVNIGDTPEPQPPTTPSPKPSPKETSESKTPVTEESKAIRFYTDGSAKGSGEDRHAGWAWICEDYKANGFLGNATNNVAELTAIREALSFATHSLGATAVEIVSDSKYAIGVCSGTMKASKNLELVSEIQELMTKLDVNFVWVKGHAGNTLNEECDRLAKEGADGHIYDEDLEAEAALAEQDALASSDTPADANLLDNTEEVMDTPDTHNETHDAATISADSPSEPCTEVSSNEGDTSQEVVELNVQHENDGHIGMTDKELDTMFKDCGLF